MKRVSLAIVGAGHRGDGYARHIVESGRGVITAVAEAQPERLARFAAAHHLRAAARYTSWQEMARDAPDVDAVIIATQDTDHHQATLALLACGYHVLVEKPMATTEEHAAEMVEAAYRHNRLLAVCHVLRYTPYTRALKRTIDSGLIGEIMSVDHLEPVGWWHQAHSYVRGNWRREDESSPMLLAKSVHDLDWLDYIIDRTPRRLASFGSLTHFRSENQPAEATDNCLTCPAEPTCPYSAPRLYLGALGNPDRERWPLDPVTSARTPEGVIEALREGPYGRCVYKSDNDVVDHQVVSIEYDGGATVSFTMSAFTPFGFRKTRIGGTHGYLEGDGKRFKVTDFRNGERRTVKPRPAGSSDAGGGHGGGDRGLIDAFLASALAGEPVDELASAEQSFWAHQLTWAAERARHEGAVIDFARTPFTSTLVSPAMRPA